MSQIRKLVSAEVPICDSCLHAIQDDLKAWLGYISFGLVNGKQDDAVACVRCERTPPHVSTDCTCDCQKCMDGKCADCQYRQQRSRF